MLSLDHAGCIVNDLGAGATRWERPGFAAVTVSFADLDQAARMMETRGIRVRRSGDDLWVPPEEANSFVLRMIPHAQTGA